ncbi:MazG family protein [Thermocrispum sp.]|uniref:MazG family protein n=1 Tax=Thermocrispum agreste TaxID=37925 RepID=A0ABD6FB35_9PSEU|nr:MazG family protein [Thermocrispum sp.]
MTAAVPGSPLGPVVVIVTAAGVPAEALSAVRAADVVYCAPGVGLTVPGAEPAPERSELLGVAERKSVVLLAADRADQAAQALVAAGARVVEQPTPPLQRAVEVMDTLRSPGGCPWDGEQTHESLRRYLLEEAYELLEAIESGDRRALREELGDVLLQVLFHARIAAEHADDPFDIDVVATELVDKLIRRHPQLFAGAEAAPTAQAQEENWHRLKQQQMGRTSTLDGVALGQPAAALAGKIVERVLRADLPEDLLSVDGPGAELFAHAARAMRAEREPEGELRAAAKRFAALVRRAEQAARADGADPLTMGADGWRRYWPKSEEEADTASA